ncbi:MAG TPA: hypothetical protein VGO31_10360 [Microbacteriaceae bacterium]|jgi:hypothetical protein|nr:hypothetical protein [Microbacteriaceae bacterium]
MSAWHRIRELGRFLDGEVSNALDVCLDRDFGNVILAPPLANRLVPASELATLLSPYAGHTGFHVVRIGDVDAANVDEALDWIKGARLSATPDTLAGEGPETLDGLPFIEIIGRRQIDLAADVRLLTRAAEEWVAKVDPDVYLVIPESMILHPWDGAIESLEASHVTEG